MRIVRTRSNASERFARRADLPRTTDNAASVCSRDARAAHLPSIALGADTPDLGSLTGRACTAVIASRRAVPPPRLARLPASLREASAGATP